MRGSGVPSCELIQQLLGQLVVLKAADDGALQIVILAHMIGFQQTQALRSSLEYALHDLFVFLFT